MRAFVAWFCRTFSRQLISNIIQLRGENLYFICFNFSSKSSLHHQAAADHRGSVQGEGEGGRERQTFRDRVRGGGGTTTSVS